MNGCYWPAIFSGCFTDFKDKIIPRLPRLNPPGVSQHVIQRGNNRQACFAANEDFAAYVHFLTKSSAQYRVKVHAWVLMTNHVHMLVTPDSSDGISKMMQSIGRRYVQYFNYTYTRSGTLWEGRFKSCLIDSEQYLLACYRYIELNPVRAKMVDWTAESGQSHFHRVKSTIPGRAANTGTST